VYGLDHDWWHAYRNRLEAVSIDDVHAAARELVRPDDALILVVGDGAKIRDELAGAGLGVLEVTAEG
jgi:hypothetical protein